MFWNEPSLYGTTFANKEFIPQQIPYFQPPWMMNLPRYGQFGFPPYEKPYLPYERGFLPFEKTFTPYERPFMPIERSFAPFDRRFTFPYEFNYNVPPYFHAYGGNVPYFHTYRPYVW